MIAGALGAAAVVSRNPAARVKLCHQQPGHAMMRYRVRIVAHLRGTPILTRGFQRHVAGFGQFLLVP